jgi:hypothetical protein
VSPHVPEPTDLREGALPQGIGGVTVVRSIDSTNQPTNQPTNQRPLLLAARVLAAAARLRGPLCTVLVPSGASLPTGLRSARRRLPVWPSGSAT